MFQWTAWATSLIRWTRRLSRAVAIDDALAGLASEASPLVSLVYSAKGGASANQILTFTRTLTLIGLTGLFVPALLFMDLSALAVLVFAAFILLRASLTLLGAMRRLFPEKKLVHADDETLPIYTLLIPLHREAETAPGLARAISELDYPPDKLHVKLFIEAGDEATEDIRIWTAQRSHWLKELMVTWLVIMREPRRAIRELGLLDFLAAQLSIAGPVLAAIAHGPLAPGMSDFR